LRDDELEEENEEADEVERGEAGWILEMQEDE
jgi:hypothetical protein